MLLALLGAIFLKGFREAIWFAVSLVAIYLALNTFVIGFELVRLWEHPELVHAMGPQRARRRSRTR